MVVWSLIRGHRGLCAFGAFRERPSAEMLGCGAVDSREALATWRKGFACGSCTNYGVCTSVQHVATAADTSPSSLPCVTIGSCPSIMEWGISCNPVRKIRPISSHVSADREMISRA